jgi:hypothetical protein
MDMIDYIYNALKSLNIPVLWNVRPNTYPSITYSFYNSTGQEFGDGEEIGTGHYLQVNVWARNKEDYVNTVTSVKTKLKEVGFTRQSEADLYESDIKLYHKAVRFFYLDNIG